MRSSKSSTTIASGIERNAEYEFSGKTAFVTGGGSGIGASVARRLAEKGANVAVFGRRREPLVAVSKETGRLRADPSWSPNAVTAKQVAYRIEAGSVWVSKRGAIQPNAPFGEIKQSGFGVEFGLDG